MNLSELIERNLTQTETFFKHSHSERPPVEKDEQLKRLKRKAREYEGVDLSIVNSQSSSRQTVLKMTSTDSKPSILSNSTSSIVPHQLMNEKLVTLKPATHEASASSSSALAVIQKRARIPKQKWHSPWKLYRVIQGHQGWVRSIDVDPSNEWFASCSNDRMIKIWDLASGTLKLSLTGHIHNVRAVKIHPHLKYLFSAGEDNQLKCWDLESNKVIRHYHGHLSGIYSLALHPTLPLLFSGSRDATVKVWDIRTKVCVHTLGGHANTVTSLAAQQEEPQVISGSADQTVRLWDLAAGKCRVTLTHHKKSIRSVLTHPRLSMFATCAQDHVKVWSCPDGGFERNIDGFGSDVLNCGAIRDDGEVIVSGSDSGSLHFWDWSSGRKFQEIKGIPQPGSLSSENGIFDTCFDKTGLRLITAECDKTIKMYKEDENAVRPSHLD